MLLAFNPFFVSAYRPAGSGATTANVVQFPPAHLSTRNPFSLLEVSVQANRTCVEDAATAVSPVGAEGTAGGGGGGLDPESPPKTSAR